MITSRKNTPSSLFRKKTLRLEEAFYDTDRLRKKGEGLVSYIARRKDRFNKLKKEGWTIPDDVKGYLLYRDAHLPEKCRELIELWTGGEYDWEEMQRWMKKLERTVPGPQHGDLPRTRLIGFQASIDDMENYPKQGNIYYNSHSSEQAEDPIYIYIYIYAILIFPPA